MPVVSSAESVESSRPSPRLHRGGCKTAKVGAPKPTKWIDGGLQAPPVRRARPLFVRSGSFRTVRAVRTLSASASVAAVLLAPVAAEAPAGSFAYSGAGNSKPCPRKSADSFDSRQLIGKSLERSHAIAKRNDCIIRVVKRDGEELDITDDLRFNRINVVLVDGHVVRIDGVY